ncbi:MAG: hypothetical protein AB1668_04835 [Nanoarchaeota archaeon]
MEIEKHNPHWKTEFFYPFPKHRELFNKLKACFPYRQIIAIYGLRRTGKTVLLKQVLNSLLRRELRPLLKFCQKYKLRKGIILSAGAEEERAAEWAGWRATIQPYPVWEYVLKTKAGDRNGRS